MDIHVRIEGRGDRSDRIYRQLREAIHDGSLRQGERLPPTRDLAAQLAVSRNTVGVAYERLAAEGYLVSRVGSGTFVAAPAQVPGEPTRGSAARRSRRRAPTSSTARPRPLWRALPDPLWTEPRPIAYDFNVGTPDPALFPLDQWRRFVAGELRRGILDAGGYGDPSGLLRLRSAIARHIGVARSVDAAADDVIVTSGAQQAFDLIGRVLIEPGDVVAVEEPGYPPVRQLFETLGARVVGVPVDDEGIVVDALPARARLVYVTPSHQFPLGAVMSFDRRLALLEWSRRSGAAIIEDDYDTEYRFADRPLDPLQSLDRGGRVIYVGTFSKTMLPALRLGFLVTPEPLRSALRSAKRLTDWSADYLTQAAMARFLDGGHFARHVRRATREYGARRQQLIDEVAREFGDALRIVPSIAGLHLCLEPTGPGFEADRVVELAASVGVAVQSIGLFSADRPATSGLVLGFGSIASADVRDGLHLLAGAIARAGAGS
jgi:GntR family transcriptional regulator/MocR family aminotransferase